ncbi:hypothetical protein CK203_051626 [Vitis vinifera]|uniref:NB-ARC domain-containing protein n=1 Tax=Vitis vinifera TaxID=29760 RepID=A0A438HBJ8_VITVI|nr:hypothetical protein CK203_051626 [Vitis vinifera]
MVEIVISIAAKVPEYLVAPVGHQLCYLFHYNCNMAELRDQVEKLGEARESLQLRVGEANTHGAQQSSKEKGPGCQEGGDFQTIFCLLPPPGAGSAALEVGKTTLVKQVTIQAKQENLFATEIYIDSSWTRQSEKLQEGIAKIQQKTAEMLGFQFQGRDETTRAVELKQRLKKKILIILDDICVGF